MLTPREADVLEAFLRMDCDKQIAPKLRMKSQTVTNHLANIERKLRVDSRCGLIRVALCAWFREKWRNPVKSTACGLEGDS